MPISEHVPDSVKSPCLRFRSKRDVSQSWEHRLRECPENGSICLVSCFVGPGLSFCKHSTLESRGIFQPTAGYVSTISRGTPRNSCGLSLLMYMYHSLATLPM
jgi:hypothetical protein